jgi:predicted MFS family arabinose efflux permease
MLVPLRESLSLLPQLFIAKFIREHTIRKWFWVGGSIGQALALVAMVPAMLLLPGPLAAPVIVALLAAFSLARGVCSVAAKDVLGKTVSKSRRGRLTGLAASAAGFVSIAVAVVIWIAPAGSGDAEKGLFALILLAAALLWLLAAFVYSTVPEVPGATEGGGNAITEALKSLSLLRTDRQLRDFIVARALLVSTAFAIPYIVVMIQQSGNSAVTGLAALLLAEGAAGLLSGPFWGRWSDRASQHVMAAAATLSGVFIAASLVIDIWLPTFLGAVTGAALVFGAAVAHQGARVGRKTYLVDMASGGNRAQYTAVSNTVIGLFLLSGGALGVLDAVSGTRSVLLFLLLIAAVAALRCARLPSVD